MDQNHGPWLYSFKILIFREVNSVPFRTDFYIGAQAGTFKFRFPGGNLVKRLLGYLMLN